jgi:hypothetical protein
MAYASNVLPNPALAVPYGSLPKLRLPRVSPRVRALLMMSIMCSPAFLSDSIGYCVRRMFYTADQIAGMRLPDDTLLAHISIFHVACGAGTTGQWAELAAQNGWPMYPQAGPTCFRPDRNLLGLVGLKTFNVACPAMVFTVADQRRWAAYSADHGWTDYSQAGAGCVDP